MAASCAPYSRPPSLGSQKPLHAAAAAAKLLHRQAEGRREADAPAPPTHGGSGDFWTRILTLRVAVAEVCPTALPAVALPANSVIHPFVLLFIHPSKLPSIHLFILQRSIDGGTNLCQTWFDVGGTVVYTTDKNPDLVELHFLQLHSLLPIFSAHLFQLFSWKILDAVTSVDFFLQNSSHWCMK